MTTVKPVTNVDFALGAFKRIGGNALSRSAKICYTASYAVLAGLMLLPSLTAADDPGYPQVNENEQSYSQFVATSVNSSDDDGQKILADVDNFLAHGIDWYDWKLRADQIRLSGRRDYCIGNLSLALSGLGPAYAAGSSGATTLLTLLPTAGALIGSPSKELWVLYKLMPLAGVLSMFLSLGGNIVPMEINDYERIDGFSYNGMIASQSEERRTGDLDDTEDLPTTSDEPEIAEFASMVHARSKDDTGSKKVLAISIGIVLQLCWIAAIIMAGYYLQSGSPLVWWCTMWPWMYLWYGCVAFSSLLENLAGVPFTKQWTIRVSRAQKNIIVSSDAPPVIPDPDRRGSRSMSMANLTASPDLLRGKAPSADVEPLIREHAVDPSDSSTRSHGNYQAVPQRSVSDIYEQWRAGDVLTRLEKGYNTHGRVIMDQQAWSASKNPFYVLISVRGVSNAHATLRVFSKFLSIGIFTVGTAMFASSTLVTILVAVVTAGLVISAGVFGRVTAMWMASQIMQNRPVLHKIVRDREEAERYIEAILRKPHMVCEILGHIITSGRCVKRYSRPLRWSQIFGVLASPYDLSKLAMPNYNKV